MGRVVRRKWIERKAKRLHHELYPNSTVEFRFSQGWFHRFLIRNAITLRIITNKAQETPEEYFETIINFLCFNQRNSQLRDGTEDLSSAVTVSLPRFDRHPPPPPSVVYCVTLGLYRNRSVERIKGNQATFDNSQRNNLRSCVWVRWVRVGNVSEGDVSWFSLVGVKNLFLLSTKEGCEI